VLPETARHAGRFDLAGAVTSTAGMAAIVFAFVHAATAGWTTTLTLGAFLAGAALLAAFGVIETRAPSPITPLRLFADRNRLSSYVARLFMVAGMMGMFFFLTQFLQEILNYSPLQSGLAFLPLTVLLFIASQATARVLSEYVSAKKLMVTGIAISTLGLLWLTQLSADSEYFALLGPLALFGAGNGIAFVPLTAMSLSGVEPKDAGAASGLVNVMQQVGGSLGLAVLVTVFSAASQHSSAHPGANALTQAHHAFTVGADRGFLTAALFLAAATALLAVAVRPTRGPA
jgi:predicted MFS family arabinose efflux permease